MTTAPALIRSSREQWLAERRKIIGASEVAAILGVDPRRNALSVYADKVAGKLDESDESWLAFGRDVEAAIAKGYSYRTGRPVRDLGADTIQRHPDLHFLGATLDRVTEGSDTYPAPASGPGPLELKAVGFHRESEWREEPPLQYVVQVQIQMACTGAPWGSLGALFGGIRIAEPADMMRDDRFLKVAYELLARFWWQVQRRQPPEADGSEVSREAIKRLWPVDDGQAVTLLEADRLLADRWEVAKLRQKEAEETRDEIENKLRVRIGEAQRGDLPDRTALMLKAESVKAQLCKGCGKEIRGGFTRRVLRRWRPQDKRGARALTEG